MSAGKKKASREGLTVMPCLNSSTLIEGEREKNIDSIDRWTSALQG